MCLVAFLDCLLQLVHFARPAMPGTEAQFGEAGGIGHEVRANRRDNATQHFRRPCEGRGPTNFSGRRGGELVGGYLGPRLRIGDGSAEFLNAKAYCSNS